MAKPSRAIAIWRDDESGATLVEFAASLAILTPIFVATMDLGLTMYRWIQLNDSAQAATLYATNNAQTLYAGPQPPPGSFDTASIRTAGQNTGLGSAATVSVTGACVCSTATPSTPQTCPSTSQFSSTNGTTASPTPYCSAALPGCAVANQSAYVCITTSYPYTPLIKVPYLLSSITLSATSMVKIH